MGKIQHLKKYKKEARRIISSTIDHAVRPEPKSFFPRLIYRLAWKIVMVTENKKV